MKITERVLYNLRKGSFVESAPAIVVRANQDDILNLKVLLNL
jgi:hypothetical protein